jgi:hypothetical protein
MQRIQMRSRNSRGLFIGGIALGAISAVAALIGGNPGMAIFGFVLLTGFGTFLAFSRSEFAVIGSADADERQRQIDFEAVQIAYMAVVTVGVCGFLWELTRGDGPGAFTLICFVGGFTHMAATAYLKRRR